MTTITATDKVLKVAYKTADGAYGVYDTSAEVGSDSGTTKPFDEVTLQVGESFTLPAGGTIVRTVQMGLDGSETPVDVEAGG